MPMLELPVEVQESIFNRCTTKDLRNLVCCSTAYHASTCINGILWCRVSLALEHLQQSNFFRRHFNLSLMSQNTQFLKITNSSTLTNTWKANAGRRKRNSDMNFKTLIEHCNATTLYVTHAPTRAYKCLASLTSLSVLRLIGVRHLFDDDMLCICRHLTRLKVFSLDNKNIDENRSLPNNFNLSYHSMEQLRFKLMAYHSLTANAFTELYRLVDLEELHLRYCPLQVLNISFRSRLKRVKLEVCDQLTTLFSFVEQDAELQNQELGQGVLKYLQQLSLLCCRGLTDSFLENSTPYLSNLKELALQNLPITDRAVESICGTLQSIEDLDIGVCSQLTDASLFYISGLVTLRKLNIQCTERCSEPRYSNAGVLALLNLQHLEYLNCEGLMKDPGLISSDLYGELYLLKNLTELHAGFARFEDDDLRYIGRITSLQRLNLQASCCNISDEGLFNLAPLKGLKSLVLDFVKNVTPNGIARLKKAIPNLLDVVYRDATWIPRTSSQ